MQLLAALTRAKPLHFPVLREAWSPTAPRKQVSQPGIRCWVSSRGWYYTAPCFRPARRKGHLQAVFLLLGCSPTKDFLSIREQLLAEIMLSHSRREDLEYTPATGICVGKGHSDSHRKGREGKTPMHGHLEEFLRVFDHEGHSVV